MNQELDTIVDDNSLEELGETLCQHFKLAMDPSKEGELLQLHLALDAAACKAQPLPQPQESDDSSEDDEDEVEVSAEQLFF